MIYVPFAFEFRKQISNSEGCSVTSGQIVMECNACYNLVKKSTENGSKKAWGELQREDREHNRHKPKKHQISYSILGPILGPKTAPRVFKKLSEKKRRKHTEDRDQIMPKLGSKGDPKARQKQTFLG